MSNLEDHEAEQAAITALCEAGECDHLECLLDYDERRIDGWQADSETLEALTPTHGGLDPDDMNDQRADWGQSILMTFCAMTGTDWGDSLADLLANLMHTAHGDDELDFMRDLRRAVAHFNAETGEG